MSAINKRLQDNPKSILAGKQINRLKPIKYKLNGIEIRCFEGDTVLSSAIANKITSAGKHNGSELALSETLSLPIFQVLKNPSEQYPQLSDLVPIERTPVINGAEFMTLKGKKYSFLTKLLKKSQLSFFTSITKPIISLGINFNKNPSLTSLWHDLKTDEFLNVDLLIIGAGVAGLSATAAQTKSSKKTILIEQRAYCGGDAVLFGHDENEKDPKEIISSFEKTIKSSKNISIITSSKAINIKENIVKIHLVEKKENKVKSKIIKIKANKIIIATGCSDHLPIFSGNRLNNISTLSSCFHLAYGYGVWANDIVSKTTTILTTNNIAYRFAMLVADCGVKFNKIIDTRIEINSRFAQFAKAYGIRTEIGLKPIKAIPAPKKDELILQMGFTINDSLDITSINSFEHKPNNIVISAGWVPRLSLWKQAGGTVIPTIEKSLLKAVGKLNNIALAGSCAGLHSTKSAIDSGKNAANILYNRKEIEIIDKRLDPLYETAGDNLPISTDLKNSKCPSYLEGGSSLICLVNPKNNISQEVDIEIENDKAFCLETLNAAYILDQLPISDFAEISQNRVVIPKNISQISAPSKKEKTHKTNSPFFEIPPYLQGRFEEKTNLVEILPSNDFLFETGELLYSNSDMNDPIKAIGVILGYQENKNIAILAGIYNHKNTLVSVSGLSGKRTAKIGNIYKKSNS